MKSESEVTQSCLTLCDPMDCSLSGSSVHEIFQVIVPKWIAISFSRGSSQSRNRTQVSRIAGRPLPSEAPGKSKGISILDTMHAKMGSIKDRNGMDLTEAEDIKKRWQEYTEELCKKDLHNQDNHDGVITDLEPDILECEVKWALGSITTNKASAEQPGRLQSMGSQSWT